MSDTLEVIIRAIDEASGTIDNVKSRMEDTASASGKLNKVGKTMQAIGGSMQDVGKGMVAASAPVLGLAGVAVKSAADFESAMSDVAKAANLEKGTEQYDNLSQTILELSRVKGMPAATEIADLAAAGGRLGVATDSLDEFVGLTAKMSAAFDMSTADAGQNAAEIANNFRMMNAETGQIDFPRLQTFGNTVNNLADSMATTERNVLNFTKRASGIASTFGITEGETAALGAAFTALGIAPERASTMFNSTATTLATATKAGGKAQAAFEDLGVSAVDMEKAFAEGRGAEAYMDFLGAVAQKGPEAAGALVDIFGKGFSDEVMQAAGGIGQFEKAFDKAAEAVAGGGSTMQSSFDIMAGTTAAQMQQLQNAFTEVAINVGSALLPAVNGIMQAIAPLATGLADFAKANPGIVQMAVGFATFVAAAGAALVVIGGIVSAIGTLISAASAVGATLAAIGGIGAVLGSAGTVLATVGSVVAGIALTIGSMLIGPLILAGAAIATVGAAFVAAGGDISSIGDYLSIAAISVVDFWSNLQQVPAVLSAFAGAIGSQFTSLGSRISLFSAQLMQIPSVLGAFVGAIGSQFTLLWSQISLVGTQIKIAFTTAFTGIVGRVMAIASQIGSAFSQIGARISAAFSAVRAAIGSAIASIAAQANQIGTAIMGAIQSAASAVQNAVGMFRTAGAALMQALAAGIASAVGSAIDAVSGAVGRIRALLPGSDAKTGPLSDLTASGAALLPTFSKGMTSTMGSPLDAIQLALAPVTATMQPAIQPTSIAPSIPAMQSRSPASGGSSIGSIEIHIHIDGRDGGDIVQQISDRAGEIADVIERAVNRRDRTRYV